MLEFTHNQPQPISLAIIVYHIVKQIAICKKRNSNLLFSSLFYKVEKYSLVSEIKRNTYQGMKLIIKSEKEFIKNKKIEYLKELDSILKMLKVLIRVSYKRKYINVNNYKSWSKKIYNIGNLLGGWINSCRKV